MVKGPHQCPPLVIHELLGTSNNGPSFQRNRRRLRTAARPPQNETSSVALRVG